MSSTAERGLTTTSYSLLSHLAMRSWSAYELAVQRQRYFHYFWPRAQRSVYTELKRLAALGYAKAETSSTGRRQRTVYSITERGRDVLRGWLDEPLAPITMEFEALLRIFSSPLGTKGQLEATLDRLRADVRGMTEFNDSIAQEYIDGRAPFQHDAHVRTLVVDFITDWMATIEAWVERTAAEIADWEDLSSDAQKQARARTRLLDARARRDRR